MRIEQNAIKKREREKKVNCKVEIVCEWRWKTSKPNKHTHTHTHSVKGTKRKRTKDWINQRFEMSSVYDETKSKKETNSNVYKCVYVL